LAAASVARIHVVVRSAFGQAQRRRWVWDNPAAGLHRIAVTAPQMHPPTPAELQVLLDRLARADPAYSTTCVTSWPPRCSMPGSPYRSSPADSTTNTPRPTSTTTPTPSPSATPTPRAPSALSSTTPPHHPTEHQSAVNGRRASASRRRARRAATTSSSSPIPATAYGPKCSGASTLVSAILRSRYEPV
jgi:hypothetical protein